MTGLDHFVDDGLAEIRVGHLFAVLRGDDHAIHAHGPAINVFDR